MLSVNKTIFIIVAVVFVMHSKVYLVKASSLVMGQPSSANSDNNNIDKEIVFISTTTTLPKTITTTSLNNTSRLLKRGKRHLDFLNTSRMFLRVNAKNTIVQKHIIWAHAYGFRCNFPIESGKRVRPFRRDTYHALEDLMEKNGFDGQACILKAYCAAHMDDDIGTNKGMLFKLLKYIFTLNEVDKQHFPYLRLDYCQQMLHSHCPLSFNNISPYTDL